MLSALLLTTAAQAAEAARAAPSAASRPELGDLGKVGKTSLKASCIPAVREDFERAVALLHSFFYDEARRVFEGVAEKDPTCAMAQWGIAMTYWHPLWTPPSDEEMKAGVAAAERAEALGGKSAIEKGLINALLTYYRTPSAPPSAGPGGQTCHGPTGPANAAQAAAYERAMAELRAKHPGDVEVDAFYALALLATQQPTDKTLGNAKKATAVLERQWKTHRDHPGITHYLIHGYDYPATAAKGLPAARAYAGIAPWVPHALHMPSHIFTRLGMWSDVVASNLASAEASRQYAARWHPGATAFEELHALDYLTYAYLQLGEDAKAQEIAARIAGVEKTRPEVDFAVAYATGAVPARYALERRQWAEAAALIPKPLASWKRFSFALANVEFARALGAARLGKVDEARAEHARLKEVIAGLTDPRLAYFGKQAAMQGRVVEGWIAFAEGKSEEAEKILREAADTDDLLGKHPVSPGSLLPAREVLADFLMERGRFADALTEYEACLSLNPKRLNSLFGAGSAADKAGKKELARKHYQALLQTVSPESTRPEVSTAKAYLRGA